MTLNQRIANNLQVAKEADHLRQDRLIAKLARMVDDWYRFIANVAGNRVTIYQTIPKINRYHISLIASTYIEELKHLAQRSHDEAIDAILDSFTEEEAQKLLSRLKLQEGILQRVVGGILAKTKQILKDVLFTPISEAAKLFVVGTNEVVQSIGKAIRPIVADALISLVTQGQLQKLNGKEIAEKLLHSYFLQARTDIQRSARTFGAYVANKANKVAYDQLGSLLAGYQHHSIVDEHSRYWHAEKNKMEFRFGGKPDVQDCMMPPVEPVTRFMVPDNAPQIAWNCRCSLSALLDLG
jgi:hypothetical protein